MKRNLTGEDAYFKIIEAVVPEKTDSYTPIPHLDVIMRMHQEIRAAKCIIIGEDYKCTADAPKNPGGQVALGMMKIKFKADDELVLTTAFPNSYNKQYAFRFAIGAQVSITGNAIMLENNFRRVHTGAADILAAGNIRDIIQGAGEHWERLVERKNKLKALQPNRVEIHDVLGELFVQQDIVTTYQLNIIKKELHRLADAGITEPNGWQLYNCVAEGIRDTHPAEWLDVHVRAGEVFNTVFGLDGTSARSTSMAPMSASFPGATEEDEEAEEEEESEKDEKAETEEEEEEDMTAMAVAAGTL